MEPSPSPKAEHLAVAIVHLIAAGIFPDRAGVSLVVRQLVHRAIELADDRPLVDIVKEVVDAWGANNLAIKERASTIDEVVRVEEESHRRRKAKTSTTCTWEPVTVGGVNLVRLTRRIDRLTDEPDIPYDDHRTVVVIGLEHEGQASLKVLVTRDLEDKVHAGKILESIVHHIGGVGGGRAYCAQGGGDRPEGMAKAMAAARGALAAQLGVE